MDRRLFLTTAAATVLAATTPAGARPAYLHHSTSDEGHFFWDAEAEPYPVGAEWFRAPERLRAEDLDPEIAELVLGMNRQPWMRTLMSCQGHPAEDNAYAAHPEVWLRLPRAEDAGRFFGWIERARRRRKILSRVFRDEALIRVDFVGQTRWGLYFVVWGQFVSGPENRRVVRALRESLG